MNIYVTRIFIATLEMYNQTGLTDWAEIFRIVQVVDCYCSENSLRYDPSGRFCSSTVSPLDHPENFSPIGPASLAVPFQSGNKNKYYVF